MSDPVTAATPEQPSLWEQTDLIAVSESAGTEPPARALPASEPTAAGAPDRETPGARGQDATRVEWPRLSQATAPDPASPLTLLIVDTETTGLDPASAHCIEVGAILFRVPERAALAQVSFLLPTATNPAEAINGIPPGVSRLPQPWRQSLDCFLALRDHADAVLAHNAAFDRQWFGQGPLPALDRPWICSMEEIRWPPERQLRPRPSVRDLALAYGVPVWAAHRALTDCIYLAQVLERCDDLEGLLCAALEPRALFRAQLSYAERHQAKAAGFRWNDPVPGAWTRRLSEREARALPFAVQRLEPEEARAA